MAADATRFRTELERVLRGRSEQDRKYLFLGVLSKHLSPSRPVLVGGSLVQFYTNGAIASADIDLVGDRQAVRDLLLAAGFTSEGRYFERTDLGLLVEVPGSDLRPTESVQEIEFEGFRFFAVTVEDAVVDRLLAAKFWQSRSDWERAIVIVEAQGGRVDWTRLMDRAAANEVADIAQELRDLVA